jgi:hypothetical protein
MCAVGRIHVGHAHTCLVKKKEEEEERGGAGCVESAVRVPCPASPVWLKD